MMMFGGIIGGRLPEVVFLTAAANSSNPINNFTQNDQPLGDEHPSRQIIILAFGSNANLVSDTNFTTSVAVGGVAATRKVAPPSASMLHFTAWITPRLDSGGPSGASGTIRVSRSTGNGYETVAFAAFAAYHLRGSDPVGSYLTISQSPSASGPVALASGGILTAFARAEITTGFTWNGADKVYDATGSGVTASQRFSAAMLNKTSGSAGHTVEADSAANFDRMIAVSWR